jgi:DNA-binding SARP family transcriptional activator
VNSSIAQGWDAAAAADPVVRVPSQALGRLCAAAVAAGIAVEEATQCLSWAGHAAAAAAVLRPPLEVYTLGRFVLHVGGRPPAVQGKSPHKPIELLQALIALGGRDVPADRLIAAVWPQECSVDPRNLFDNTLHRLRHLLGDDRAVQLRDAHVTLVAGPCWVDAWRFDRLAGRALEDGATAGDAVQALQLYAGPFLAGESPRPWIQRYRDRLHARFLRLATATVGQLDGLGRWGEAAAWCERALEVDPGAGSLYLLLLDGHARRGARADVLRVYARCRAQFAGAADDAARVLLEEARSVVAAMPGAP